MKEYLNLRPNIALGLIFAFFFSSLGPIPTANAEPIYSVEGEFHLPAPGILVPLSPEFNPPILKGIKVHPDDPFRFEFILDIGDSQLSNNALKDESSKLIKYFLASLTIPEKDLWVNLSPYEKDRIIPQSFGLTEMGRDLLAEDYMLKQITASLIYPEDAVGKKFWKRIYEEAGKKFGTTNVPVNTFNKVWIVPEKAVVYENAKAGTAYVVESRLKVMLEQDYLALSKNTQTRRHFDKVKVSPSTLTNALGSKIVREIVIPQLTKEINEDKNFSQLRQVYNSLILATWYKKKIKDSILEQVYADKNKVAGVNIDDPQEKQRIYERYLQAFKKGVYNYIKEEFDPLTQQQMPRKYFSGGEVFAWTDKAMSIKDQISPEELGNTKNLFDVSSQVDGAMGADRTGAAQGSNAAMTAQDMSLFEQTSLSYISLVNIRERFHDSIWDMKKTASPNDLDFIDKIAHQIDDKLRILEARAERGQFILGDLDDFRAAPEQLIERLKLAPAVIVELPGTFDPPHLKHINVLLEALVGISNNPKPRTYYAVLSPIGDQFKPKQSSVVWKANKLPFEERYQMSKLISDIFAPLILTSGINRTAGQYPYRGVLGPLASVFNSFPPDLISDFFTVKGEDTLVELEARINDNLKDAPKGIRINFVILNDPSHPSPAAIHLRSAYPKNIVVVDDFTEGPRSTDIRNKKQIGILPLSIQDYIRRNTIYGVTETKTAGSFMQILDHMNIHFKQNEFKVLNIDREGLIDLEKEDLPFYLEGEETPNATDHLYSLLGYGDESERSYIFLLQALADKELVKKVLSSTYADFDPQNHFSTQEQINIFRSLISDENGFESLQRILRNDRLKKWFLNSLSAHTVYFAGNVVMADHQPVAVIRYISDTTLRFEIVSDMFDLKELEKEIGRLVRDLGWKMDIAEDVPRDYVDKGDLEERRKVLRQILEEEAYVNKGTIDWIFRINEKDLRDPARLFEIYSRYKFEDVQASSYFAGLLSDDIRSKYGKLIEENPQNWVIVTSSPYKIYNTAVNDVAERIARSLGIAHRALRDNSGRNDLVNLDRPYTAISSKEEREARLIAENEKIVLEGDPDFLKGKDIIYIDDAINTGITVKHAFRSIVDRYLAQRVHIFSFILISANDHAVEQSLTQDLFRQHSWNALLQIVQNAFKENDFSKTNRVVRRLLSAPTIIFDNVVSFLPLESLKVIYTAARENLRMPESHEKIIHLAFLIHAHEKKRIVSANPVGGIDLTAGKMNFQIKGSGEIKFHLDPAMLQQLQNAPGFVPVIINIKPLTNLPEFLGIPSH